MSRDNGTSQLAFILSCLILKRFNSSWQIIYIQSNDSFFPGGIECRVTRKIRAWQRKLSVQYPGGLMFGIRQGQDWKNLDKAALAFMGWVHIASG